MFLVKSRKDKKISGVSLNGDYIVVTILNMINKTEGLTNKIKFNRQAGNQA